MMFSKIFMGLLLASAVVAQGPGKGMSKNTYAASNPAAAKKWMFEYLPVQDADNMPCTNSSTCEFYCSTRGRVALTNDVSLSTNALPGPLPGFGIHTVNCLKHPEGEITVQQIESTFTERLGDFTKYDPFADHNIGVYANNLDYYIKKFQTGKVPFLPLKWGYKTKTYYGILVQIPGTQVILDFMSASQSTLDESVFLEMEHPRYTFSVSDYIPSTSSKSESYLTPVKVSRASTDVARDVEFYTNVLNAKVLVQTQGNGFHFAALSLPGSDMELHFVQRDEIPPQNAPVFSVADFEKLLQAEHHATIKNNLCGFSKWFDNHFALDQFSVSLDTIKSRMDARGTLYHIWDMSNVGPHHSTTNANRKMCNIYLVDPTGFSVQLDGQFSNCPTHAAYFSTCTQGYCPKELTAEY